MTARTTTLTGADAGRYYVEHELDYYLDRGEPPGRWHGRGAEQLGLDGPVDEDDFLALMDGLDPSTGRLLGTRHTERTVRGYDVTCSAPKSVSVLYAIGGDVVRAEVVEAHDAAVAAVVDWIERHAHTRYRVNGQVCVFDADGIIAAAFRQHTSRALDPQLHTHVVIANRVPAPDGRWLALDARTIKQDQQTLSWLYHAGLRAELTRSLGVRWREPVNGIAEIVDVPEPVLREFSQRTEAIAVRIEDTIERFYDTHDRAPTPRERWRLERDAVLHSRPSKQDADPLTLDEEWAGRAADLGISPGRLVAEAAGRVRGVDHLGEVVRAQVTDAALETLADTQSTWRVAELVRELAAAVPTDVAMPAEALDRWLDDLADEIVLARMVDLSRPVPANTPRRQDGRPITEGRGRPAPHDAGDPRPRGATACAGRAADEHGERRPSGRERRRPHARPRRTGRRRRRRPPAGSRRRPRRHGQVRSAATRGRPAPQRGTGRVRRRTVGDRGRGSQRR